MEVKEREKNDAQAQYTESVEQFEKVATQLYELLKKKENLEHEARQQVSNGVSILRLQQTENQLLRLQQEINRQQKNTQFAREKMNRKQNDLVNVSVEVKKYQKMKERKFDDYVKEQAFIEVQHMDEISVQLFARR